MIKRTIECLVLLAVTGVHAQEPPISVPSVPEPTDAMPIDTLASDNEAVHIVLYNDNTWRYVRNTDFIKDDSIYLKHWSTTSLFPYNGAALPESVAIELVDSLQAYHYPYKARVYSKYGMRRRRQHQGVDLPLKVGDPIYATFNGRVRISLYNTGGYGNLIILRHDNGLETVYGHLTERAVQAGDWVEAGQIIGYGGSTGRSSGPHLHFETRYYGQSFDPERLIDFEAGTLRQTDFLLKRSFFSINSSFGQDFEEEDGDSPEEEVKKPAAAQHVYHKIKSGDTLGAIARKYGTTVRRVCQLNGINEKKLLQIGKSLRVK